ncbi:uncharacterized protein LOC117101957 isoform X2 [Anneissia japonica]|uniref:uncharacterized protein LOC117101957 isoform X2 n=1 Tax=Anneissia japonica TaxID=1529436 RepID=UPI0014255461|nr:uncharacterized protein LOC117101957 isoform X2 [Anneissia japonica]
MKFTNIFSLNSSRLNNIVNRRCYFYWTIPLLKSIYKSGRAFEIPEDTLNNFYEPTEKSVPEALASPAKRRLTISAKVDEVYPTQDGPSGNWRRTDVILADEPTAKRIRCKLWNNNSSLITPAHKGQMVTLQNVQVEVYKDKTQLKSTDMTTISVQDVHVDPISDAYTVIGIDEDETNIFLITDEDKSFSCRKTTLFNQTGWTTAAFTDHLPQRCTITSLHTVITHIDIHL